MKSVKKSICIIIFLLVLIVMCMFAIRNAIDPSTIKIKKIDMKEFEARMEIKEKESLMKNIVEDSITIDNIV